MRFIGHLPSEQAALEFSNVLLSLGIEHQVEKDEQGEAAWALWVHSEDDFGPAAEKLREFLRNPASGEFVARAREGAVKRQLVAEDAEATGSDRREVLRQVLPYGVGALTAVLAGTSIAIACAVWAGYGGRVLDSLLITRLVPNVEGFRPDGTLPEIFKQGEFWRLLTPALVHFNVAHLLLNMLWWIDLGSAIEARQGTGRLGFLFVTLGVGSNLAQAWYAGAAFCGMSGVLYGLLGYIWMKGKFDPESGLSLHPYTVVLMLIFFIMGLGGAFTIVFGISVANGAHAAGLLLGVAFGFLTSLSMIWQRRKK
jgi:GlpG protein